MAARGLEITVGDASLVRGLFQARAGLGDDLIRAEVRAGGGGHESGRIIGEGPDLRPDQALILPVVNRAVGDAPKGADA